VFTLEMDSSCQLTEMHFVISYQEKRQQWYKIQIMWDLRLNTHEGTFHISWQSTSKAHMSLKTEEAISTACFVYSLGLFFQKD